MSAVWDKRRDARSEDGLHCIVAKTNIAKGDELYLSYHGESAMLYDALQHLERMLVSPQKYMFTDTELRHPKFQKCVLACVNTEVPENFNYVYCIHRLNAIKRSWKSTAT
eukprot:c14595_g1_i1.p2 GENE.c14595_g1_i1~~c14595_g1_i1.p2  ORF type:complete len:110 (+),score=14.48 c14595_g1_i1:798-1127(+)